jgi:hypothetical protein
VGNRTLRRGPGIHIGGETIVFGDAAVRIWGLDHGLESSRVHRQKTSLTKGRRHQSSSYTIRPTRLSTRMDFRSIDRIRTIWTSEGSSTRLMSGWT